MPTCADPACRWATDEHTTEDLAGTLGGLARRWGRLLKGLPAEVAAALQPSLVATAAAVGAADTSLDAIDAAARALHGDTAHAAVHATEHALSDGGRVVAAAGVVVPHAGIVAGLFASDGGVPKRPITEAVVGRRGVAGDRQATRKHHGRVFQALCLWSAEVVEALAAEGHPIGPGSAGENVLLRGIDWRSLRPGVRLELGTVLAEVSSWSPPCANNAQWFADRDFRRIDHDRHPGWSRAYATVLRDGTIRVGNTCNVGGLPPP